MRVFCSGKSVTLVWHTVTLQDLTESRRVYCVVARQHRPMLGKSHRQRESGQCAAWAPCSPLSSPAAHPPHHHHLFGAVEMLSTKCIRALFMLSPLGDVQYVQWVTARPVCVNSYVCSDTRPRAAYVYVRLTATHRSRERAVCVCEEASSPLNSSYSLVQIKQQIMLLFFLIKGRERISPMFDFLVFSQLEMGEGLVIVVSSDGIELSLFD